MTTKSLPALKAEIREEFEREFGCRPYSIEEGAELEKMGKTVLYSQQGEIIKSFLDTALVRVAEAVQEPEIVICAAILMPDGYVIRGHRHADCIRTMSEIPRYAECRPYSGNQGFVTSRNRFVNRVEACQIQKAAGIKSVLEGAEAYLHGELYSEDLY